MLDDLAQRSDRGSIRDCVVFDQPVMTVFLAEECFKRKIVKDVIRDEDDFFEFSLQAWRD